MWDILIKSGVARQLDHDKRPNSYLVRSDPKDVARVESRTFICSEDEADAGPNNNWIPPDEMRKNAEGIIQGLYAW